MKSKEVLDLLIRYIILLILPLFNLIPLYELFKPLTLYPVLTILNLGYIVTHQGTDIFIQGAQISLVEACIAGAAYYLLLILAFATPMSWKKRLKILILLWISFLIINILRIVIFTALFIQGFSFFDIAHRWIWYFGSTLLVVLLWFFFIGNIKEIPFITDLKMLFKSSRKDYKPIRRK